MSAVYERISFEPGFSRPLVNSSMSWSLDSGNGFVTIAVGVVDCGTF